MLTRTLQWIWYLTFGAQSFADIAIAATLSVILIKRRTGFRKYVVLLPTSLSDDVVLTWIAHLYSLLTCPGLTLSYVR